MPATDDYLRSPKSMHRVFFASALLLLAVTLWMMWADYNDQWRGFQRQAIAFQAKRDEARQKQITSDPAFKSNVQALQEKIETAKLDVQEHEKELDELVAKAKAAKEKVDKHMRNLKLRRAERDVARANYNLGVRDDVPQLKKLETDFSTIESDVRQKEAEFVELSYEYDQAKAAVSKLTARRDAAVAAKKAAEANVTLIHASIMKLDPQTTNWDGTTDANSRLDGTLRKLKLQLMQMPIIDGFNGRERVTQDWMPKLEIDLGGMSKVSRFDRCRTCHAMIDAVDVGTSPAFPFGAEKDGKYRQPYASHPRLDLYLTSASPHPLPKFGCTVCHEGQGSGTSFANASHTPNDPAQMASWEGGKLQWFDNHFWEHPMYPQRFQESGCIKCHVNVTELGVNEKFGPTAPKVFEGYNLVKTYGCFGCHEISGYDGTKVVGPDLRLEPSTPEEAARIAKDPLQVAGKMRKVGPSLRHSASKSDQGFVAHWTEEPRRFRPTTRMPQFFKLDNQRDEMAHLYTPVEIAAVAHYLQSKSVPFETLSPAEGYKPDAARGQNLFATRGCVVCHSHEAVPGISATFGPELSKINAKLKAGKKGFDWLYTWIRDPERYHPRTKMPNLFLDSEGTNDGAIDPAADIAAFLLKTEGGPASFTPTATFETPTVDDSALDLLIRSMLAKSLTTAQIDELLKTGKFPIPRENIKTDEIELVGPEAEFSAEEWKQRKLTYVGRKTITKYGCYGCHDIPNFENGRPVGTALQDWGKKDRSRLAFEHIHEYLHHHGNPSLGVEFEALDAKQVQRLALPTADGVRVSNIEPGHRTEGEDSLKLDDVVLNLDGVAIKSVSQLQDRLSRTVVGDESRVTVLRGGKTEVLRMIPDGSMQARVDDGIGRAKRGEFKVEEEKDRELSAAFYYESLTHHGRPGFLWQKLRQPRSYDYKTVETKSQYDDRLRMPKFPLSEKEIDAIATFVVGLTAEPPAPEYMFNPGGAAGARIRGEQLIEQYNCSGCHMLEMPKIRYAVDVESLTGSDTSGEYPEAVKLLKELRPPRNALTGGKKVVTTDGEKKTLSIMELHGLVASAPNPDDAPEDQEYVVELWETLKVAAKEFFPTYKFIFPAANLEAIEPARGGKFAEWLVSRLVETKQATEPTLAWQMSPPPLYKEGTKVQTPWLFNFLKNPGKIRHTTVLRMPRFNMSDEEAQSLANYFAAVDEVPYPYQLIAEREPNYLNQRDDEFHAKFPTKKDDYLSESWKMLNVQLCIKCHSVGGNQVKITDPAKDIRGPNLDLAADRLRPDWTLLWLYKPNWVTPYTSMPVPLPPPQPGAQPRFPELFGDDGQKQTVSLRDALMNYHKLLERDGKAPSQPAPSAPVAGGGQ